MRFRGTEWIVCGLVAAGLTTAGQEVDREDVVGGLAFVDEVQVTVVNIDVFVRDQAGNAVTGLSKEDFRLMQDGQERKLSHFAAYTQEVISEITAAREAKELAAAAPSPRAEEEEVAEGRSAAVDSRLENLRPVHIVLYVDNENIRPFDRNRVLAQVRRFVDRVMQPHVEVMVISVQRSPRIVQPFTDDSKAVKDALRSLTQVYGARVDSDRSRGRIIRDMQAIMDDAPKDRRADSRTGLDLQDRIRTYGEELSMELNYSVNSLREVLTTLAGLPGRRVLVHISSGLPAVPARDLVEWYGELYQKTSTLPLLARFNRRYVYESVASSANAQGVTFYTIDASGLGGGGSASAEHARPIDPLVASIHLLNYQEPLLYLAERTGGRAIVDSNDVTELLEEMRDDLFTYYSLGYTLSSSGSDTVHRIEVELPAHPEYELVYRRTLVEKSLETRVQERVVSGLMLELDNNPMGLDIAAGALKPAAGDRWILPVEVAIPIRSVALLPEAGEYVGRIVLFIANRDMKGKQSDIQRRQFEIRMPSEDYETRRDENYVAALDLLLNPGEHRVVIGVLDPVTRQASFASLRRAVEEGGPLTG
jgi:VWFA-related protein